MIDPGLIDAIFRDCLYDEAELPAQGLPEGCVAVEGIMSQFGLHPVRLASHRQQIIDALLQLPDQFFPSRGGCGGGFRGACMDRNGTQWTGEHRIMEQLFVLGMASGVVESLVPREEWSRLPGRTPVYAITLSTREEVHSQ